MTEIYSLLHDKDREFTFLLFYDYLFVHKNYLRNHLVPTAKEDIFLRSGVMDFCLSVFTLPRAEVVELKL